MMNSPADKEEIHNISECALENKDIRFSFCKSLYFFFRELKILWIAFQHDAVIEEINKNYKADSFERYKALQNYSARVGVYSEETRAPYHSTGALNNPAFKAAADTLSNKLRTYLSDRKALFFAGIATIFAFVSIILVLISLTVSIFQNHDINQKQNVSIEIDKEYSHHNSNIPNISD